MTGKEQIKEALHSIMDEGDAEACTIEKGWNYDSGIGTVYGWWYAEFGKTAIYLGSNISDALATISAIADDLETELAAN